MNNNKTTKEIMSILQSRFKWMTIKKYKSKVDGKMKYRIDDVRFAPASCWKYELTESEFREEVKPYLKMDEGGILDK